MSLTCNKCNSENRDNSKFCSKCGNLFAKKQIENEHNKILGNRYKIEKLIKSGGMGAIYKAKHIKLDEICAIKELIFTSPDPKENQYGMKRFYEEAKLLSKLRHQNLPVVTDFFDENNKYYIVMDYIEGEELENILKKHGNPGLSENLVRKWAEDILSVLDYIHNQNPPVIYRDIKPSNIMIRHSDKRLMLVDFGIAKAVQGNVFSGQTAIGTYGYAPIEQYRGAVEPRSDLYALGATIHYLLTGLEPKICVFQPLREINSSISLSMEEIVKKALQEKAENRFSSAADMLKALREDNKKDNKPASSNIPTDKLNITIKADIKSQTLYKTPVTEEKNIDNIKKIINNWGNNENWFTKDYGNKIKINNIFKENAFIISLEALYMERKLKEGTEPCSEESLNKLPITNPSYKSLSEFSVNAPPSGFTTRFDEDYIFTGSKEICKCKRCYGTGEVNCKYCRGKKSLSKTRELSGQQTAQDNEKCKYCNGTGKSLCDSCNGYKKVIKYLYFTTKYYPMYFTETLYNGNINNEILEEAKKTLIYEEYIFDGRSEKSIDKNKLQLMEHSIFKDVFNSILEKINAHKIDIEEHLNTPFTLKLSIEEIIIREIQFNEKKKQNTIWIYGTGEADDKVHIKSRPLIWATEDIIDGVKTLLKRK